MAYQIGTIKMILWLLLLLLSKEACLGYEVTSYQGSNFTHMELHVDNGVEFLVLAQKNELLYLRWDFREKFSARTGPKNDSATCLPHQARQNLPKCHMQPTDNYVRAMQVHNGSLYVCMSYLRGSCDKIPLNRRDFAVDFKSIDEKLRSSTRAILCRDLDAKTLLTVSRKYSKRSNFQEDGLYLSMPVCDGSHFDNAVESVISVVDLRTLKPFRIGGFSSFSSEIVPEQSLRRPQLVMYHYSFEHITRGMPFVYFVLTARDMPSMEPTLRIARLCSRDLYMEGYVEVKVRCGHPDLGPGIGFIGETAVLANAGSQLARSMNITIGEKVLFLTSRMADGTREIQQGVCGVPISVINQHLDDTVADCAQGKGMMGPPYIRQVTTQCRKRASETLGQRPYCVLSRGRSGWAGMFSSSSDRIVIAKLLVNMDLVPPATALSVQALQNGATVLYVGTATGLLLRYNLQSLSQNWMFQNSSVGSAPNPVLAIRTGIAKLYTLTATEVISHHYAECKMYRSCDQCLKSHNPYCVWANNGGGCRRWQATADPVSYIRSASRCLQVIKVLNSEINVDTTTERMNVSITARNAPSTVLYCFYMNSAGTDAFDGSRPAETVPYQHEDELSIICPVAISELQGFLRGKSTRQLNMRLSGDRTNSDYYFASVNITVYSCLLHPNCSSCLQSSTRCMWCSLQARCVHAASENCDSDAAADAVAKVAASCPSVHAADPSSLVIPSGSNATLLFDLQGYKEYMQTFSCHLSCPENSLTFPALLKNGKTQLLCQTSELRFSSSVASKNCKIGFYWRRHGASGQLDNNCSQLLMYKCENMARSCDTCTQYTQPQFRCAWCSSSSTCSHECAGDSVGPGELCLQPVVRSVMPEKITTFGNLLLNVTGSNLGVNPDTIQAMLVSGDERHRCELLPETYRVGRSFSCRILGNRLSLPGNETRLLVALRAAASAQLPEGAASSADLSTMSTPIRVCEPRLHAMSAGYVQQNGRALVVITGADLDAGSELSVRYLSDTYAPSIAQVTERESQSLTVRLSDFVKIGRFFVEISVQSVHRQQYRNLSLSVVPNSVPTVSEPRTLVVPAGGLEFRIPVQRIHAVQLASMAFKELSGRGRMLQTRCHASSVAGIPQLECPSPPLPLGRRRRRRMSTDSSSFAPSTNFSVTLQLDDLRHLYGIVQLMQQPELLPIAERIIQLPRDTPPAYTLQLIGRNLLPALRFADIHVTVGPSRCSVFALRSMPDGTDEVSCQLALDPSWVDQPNPVLVAIGNRRYELGSVRFDVQFNWAYAYAGAGAGVALLLALVIALLVQAHRRSRRHEKSRRVEVQINLLEAQVSQTCRDAFAELQLNSNNDRKLEEFSMPMPIRTFNEFACHSCFGERYSKRHNTQDPIFGDVYQPSALVDANSELRSALDEFHALLLNEEFLLTMIATMESRSTEFKHQERNRFGSLLSALLYERIDYFTVVLTKLVQSLIAKKKEANDNYKVVFRRCDSVAERLLPNWLSFLMYEQLCACVSEPLYSLYCGVKVQVYKGPVDQVTEDSKYTINEQKLLKKEIQFKELHLTFEDRECIFGDGQQPMLRFQVTVLDCDSVHQAKEKIMDAAYCVQRVPYSQRQKAQKFLLAQSHATEASEATSGDKYLVLEETDNEFNDDGIRRLRRISNYFISDSDQIVFLKHSKEFTDNSGHRATLRDPSSFAENASLPSANSWRSLHDCKTLSASSSRLRSTEPRYFHLLPPYNTGQSGTSSKRKRKGTRLPERSESQQIVSEVFYPVLLRTKRLLTDRITDLFTALFPVQRMEQSQTDMERVPLCIKYLFDVLDDIVHDKRLSREVAHVWKANALMLRFYTHNLLNLDCLLDVATPGPVKYCMSTVSTVFMEACSVEKPSTPDRSSPAQKLLFVNEIADFHPRVETYFKTVSSGIREPVPDILSKFLQQVKLRNCRPFNTDAVLLELFHCFVRKYHDDIVSHLVRKAHQASVPLAKRLEFAARTIEAYSPCCSNSHTLCSTQSSKPIVQSGSNHYEN